MLARRKRKILPLNFYRRATDVVARDLIGKILVHQIDDQNVLSGRIVETEAYLGARDPACHSYPERRTERTEVLFWPGGYSYVYFIYGVHFCFNVVTEKKDLGEAVLVRALEPLEGIPLMQKRRKVQKIEQLCSGPGKLCQALRIGRQENRLKLNQPPLWIEDGPPVKDQDVVTTTRIGIAQKEAKDFPLRFYLRGSKHISKL